MKFIGRAWPLLLVLVVVAFLLFRHWRRKARLQRRLAEIEDKLRHHPPFSETAYVLNPDGTDVFPPITLKARRKPFTTLKLHFSSEQFAQMKGKILLHSHTTFGKSFSDSDVQLFLENGLREIRAITGTHRYTMAQPTCRRVSWDQIATDVQKWDKLLSAKRQRYGSKPLRNRWHGLWLYIANQYGLSYRWEPL